MRKTRSDAVLLNLPEEQQAKLADWLLSGIPYHEARVLVAKEFGQSPKSLSAFAEFWRVVCQPHLLARRSRALGAAGERAVAARVNPGEFDLATLDAIKQKAYELAESPGANPKDVKAILTLVLKARDQDLEEKHLTLDRKKFERETCELFLKWVEDERARSIATSGEDNSSKMEKLGSLMFGEDWGTGVPANAAAAAQKSIP